MATITEESTARKEEVRSNNIRVKPMVEKGKGNVKERSNSRSVEKQVGRATEGNFAKKKDQNAGNEERKNSIKNRQPPKTISAGFGANNYK